MRGLRVLKVLLPAALILFVLLLLVALNLPPSGHGGADPSSGNAEKGFAREVTGLEVTEVEEGSTGVDMDADRLRVLDDQTLELEGVKRLTLPRRDGRPLIVRSDKALVEGQPGDYRIRFDDGVRVEDPDRDLVATLPLLEFDQAAGEARSRGEIRLESPRGRGRAASLVYGLNGQPAELFEPRFEGIPAEDGGVTESVEAEKAYLLDGLDDVQLSHRVRFRRGDERLSAENLRLQRSEDGWLRRMEAQEQVRATLAAGVAGPATVESDRLEASWASADRIDRLDLTGSARLSQGDRQLSADRISARQLAEDDGGWQLDAGGTVHVAGLFAGGPAWVRCELLTAWVGPELDLRKADASGHVVFEAPSTRAESDTASYRRDGDPQGTVRLTSNGGRKARLSREQTRVAALEIETDPGGRHLEARGEVEATLLPASGGQAASRTPTGLFRPEEAVHFISDRLVGTGGGETLTFRDGVRAWQGERNLAADQVRLIQAQGRLEAIGKVSTRIPRDPGDGGLIDADFMHIAAERLDYDDRSRHGEYTGRVRVTLAEGWMESERLEIDVAETGGTLTRVTALGKVRVEFEDRREGQAPGLTVGTADRLIYEPADGTVRLLGDESPATLRRLGGGGVTTSGRVLHYNLELGTLEVDSGQQLPSRIRSE